VTVLRETRCNRRVAPGRLSPAAPSGFGNPASRGAREAGRGGRARPFGGSHRFAGRPVIPAPALPSRMRPPPPASLNSAGRRAPGAPEVPAAGPQDGRGPRSSTSPSAEMEPSPATPPDSLVGAPSAASLA